MKNSSDTQNVSQNGLKLLQQLIQDPNLTQERRRVILSETLVKVNQQIGTPLVLASLNNLTKVIELLLKNELVDVEQTCTIYLDDDRRADDVTALWVAAYANHLDTVKLLVLNGADPNHCTRSKSSPLRTACFHGWKDIVFCLINYGADVNLANSDGSTSLMAAAYNGHRDTVTVLVNKNADLNAKDHQGNTALHYAAERGHLQVVKMLVRLDAKIVANDEGLTPLKLACNACQDDIMKYFVLRAQSTRYDIIEALELLGATYANHPTKCNTDKAYKLLSVAMQHRYNEPDGDVLHKFVRPPVRAYGYRFECQTPEELDAIKDQPRAIHMEGLIVRERLLRTWNLSVPLHIRYRGACLADGGHLAEAAELWKYAAKLDQKSSHDCLGQLYRIGLLMTQMMSKKDTSLFTHIEEVFTLLLSEMERVHSTGDDPAKLQEARKIAVMLIGILLMQDLSRKENRRFMKHVKKFITQEKSMNSGGNTTLHLAVSQDLFQDDKVMNHKLSMPNPAIVRLLLDAGANPDAVNSRRSTPLHIIASLTDHSSVQSDIIKELLMAGATRGAVNDEMQTPLDHAQTDEVKTLLSTFAARG